MGGKTGLPKGTVSKKELVERLGKALEPALQKGTRTKKWIDGHTVPQLLEACEAFGANHGIPKEMLVATLVANAQLRAKKSGGDVYTVKLYLRTLLGGDEDLCERLDQYAQCWGIIHSWSTVLMELLVRRVLGDVSEDPAYRPPLWTNELPSPSTRDGRRQHHLPEVRVLAQHLLCQDPHLQNSFLSQLILPEYRHHAHFERDYLLQELLDDEEVKWLLAPYNEEIGERWLLPFTDPDTGQEREASWMNARTYLGEQMKQNLEATLGYLWYLRDLLWPNFPRNQRPPAKPTADATALTPLFLHLSRWTPAGLPCGCGQSQRQQNAVWGRRKLVHSEHRDTTPLSTGICREPGTWPSLEWRGQEDSPGHPLDAPGDVAHLARPRELSLWPSAH